MHNLKFSGKDQHGDIEFLIRLFEYVAVSILKHCVDTNIPNYRPGLVNYATPRAIDAVQSRILIKIIDDTCECVSGRLPIIVGLATMMCKKAAAKKTFKFTEGESKVLKGRNRTDPITTSMVTVTQEKGADTEFAVVCGRKWITRNMLTSRVRVIILTCIRSNLQKNECKPLISKPKHTVSTFDIRAENSYVCSISSLMDEFLTGLRILQQIWWTLTRKFECTEASKLTPSNLACTRYFLNKAPTRISAFTDYCKWTYIHHRNTIVDLRAKQSRRPLLTHILYIQCDACGSLNTDTGV
ncbi:hypothetical protein K440DRAFT_646194 [Wilcoxina mikolae CBS 423.85]|nr:hypothetical protein K440DRAFT_646194 [Wilcoxina mikolae CBS 423.85]